MLRKIILPLVFLILGYGLWVSSDLNQIGAGIAIFLFGMLCLEDGFKLFTGGVLEKLLKKTTNKIWKSLGFGVISTSIMQSSSLVSVITISFISAGLIPLVSGVGIIFGANLGTTTGAWLLAGFGLKVKISTYAMPMLVFGILSIFQKSKSLKGCGYILTGLGFLFLGIHHMKDGFETIADQFDLTKYAVDGYAGVFLFAGLGMLATVVMQSSHATLVLIITALGAGQVTYENALALAIGANIGTTITAIIGSLSANVGGRRLAAAHLIFNAVTALVTIALIYQMTDLVEWLSGVLGIAEDNYTLKLAVFHSVFNTLGILLMLPFINRMVSFLERVIHPSGGALARPRYLTESASELADTAIEAVRKETIHIYEKTFVIICETLRLSPDDIVSEDKLKNILKSKTLRDAIDVDERYNSDVKALHAEILAYSGKVQPKLTSNQLDELYELRDAGRNLLGAIKATKHLQKNMEVYLRSEDQTIRAEYEKIRLRLAKVLRQLEANRQECLADDEFVTSVALDALISEVNKTCMRRDRRLDKLIRNHQVTPERATSLMNDYEYAARISKLLLRVSSTLFSPHDPDDRNAERSVMLEDNELDQATEIIQSP